MNESNDLALCPVVGGAVAPIAAVGGVVIRLDFLTHAMQAPSEAHRGRNYLLTSTEARKLAAQIVAACEELESGAPPTGTGPRH